MNEASWYALWVRSRQEFVSADELRRKGIETYLPSVSRLRQWKDRKKLVIFPLFPGYLFVHVAPHAETFLNVIKTRGAVSLLGQEPGCPAPVDQQEIDSLRLMIDSGKPLDLYPQLQEGAPVRIKQGPLKGACGLLAEKNDQRMFVVNINLLGRSIGMKIDAGDIECA
jgi:transcription antitermination factor NusG